MSPIYYILLGAGLLVVVLLSRPLIIRVDSKWILAIQWTMFKLQLTVAEGQDVKIKMFVLFKWFKLGEKKPTVKKKKTTKKKKAKKKLPFDVIKETLLDRVIIRIVKVLVRFSIRLLKAVKINLLKCNIGLNDYYQQGILTGLLAGAPSSTKLQLKGNFEERNDFSIILHLSLWRLIWALILLLLSFPYYRTIILLLKVRRSMVLVENR